MAITYSVAENQEGMIDANNEIIEIMEQYNAMFGTNYTDIDLYNQNINKRLARKEAQYQKDGQWLDFVIVVDRLLTGFDAPTIQTLYVDRELRYQKLLQAFSRTNRTYPGKNIGMIVTFRKPKTMAANVRDAIKLFSNEDRDWENLVPKQYAEVKQSFKVAYKNFVEAHKELTKDPQNIKKQLSAIKTFQTLSKLEEAIKSYEEYEDEFDKLCNITQTITDEVGNIENLKAEVKETLAEQNVGDEEIKELFEIEFSSEQRASFEEKIDSYYIAQLLRDIQKEDNKQRFDEIIQNKPKIVKEAYDQIMNSLSNETEIVDKVALYFKKLIREIIAETAIVLKVSEDDLLVSFHEYRNDKAEVPYINVIIDKSSITREEFEPLFHKKFRERRRTIEAYWKATIEDKLLPLREELSNLAVEFKKVEEPQL